MRHTSRAFTLVEFILALVISMVILALVVSVGVDRDNDQRTQEATYGIQALRERAENAYATSMGFMDATGASISGPELFTYDQRLPRGVYSAAAPGVTPTPAQITNTWGGTIIVATSNSVPTAPAPCGGAARAPKDLLSISTTKVPAKACNQMIGTLAPQSYATYVNGTLVGLDPAPSAAGPGRRAVRYAQAAPLCNNAENTLAFLFLKPLDLGSLRSFPPTTQLTPTEAACTNQEYNRVQNAWTARETAQAALP